jgi:NFU1 iron-sulfur cluster scaffold homolog, mitochondrial
MRSIFRNLFSRRLYIQVVDTPNEHAIKFLPGIPVSENIPVEFLEKSQAVGKSPLAQKLFDITGIKTIFFGSDFISVSKNELAEWKHIKPQVLATITDHLTAKEPILLNTKEPRTNNSEALPNSDGDPKVVEQIIKILDTKVRPAVQNDGGDVEFRGFLNGWVQLRLQGACRSCSSSVITLRNGIENMLMYYIPEVKGVEQIDDELDEVSIAQFKRNEKELEEGRSK